ncbi:MAG TPA: hypothetical protein VK979_05325 [Guyparkeria sp.]|nr:hypothetical protein [Guyparkeria sp.]
MGFDEQAVEQLALGGAISALRVSEQDDERWILEIKTGRAMTPLVSKKNVVRRWRRLETALKTARRFGAEILVRYQ